VERGICPIAKVHNERTVPIVIYILYFARMQHNTQYTINTIHHYGRMHCACTKRPYFHFRSKIWRHRRVPRPRFPLLRRNFGNSATKWLCCIFSLRMREKAVLPLPV